MARPRDWSPLEESDPVSGEPERITDEARRLRDTATEMRSQISRLRAIGQDDNKGRFADTLRTAAADLAGQLEKTVGRYQRVAGALSSWAPELVHAQTESVQALDKAKAAEATRAANTVIRAVPRPGDPPPTPAEQARERRREATLDQAARDLAAARQQLDDAVEHAQRRSRHFAGQIKDAIDDDVKDSWWDNRKDWIDRHAEAIELVTKILGYVVTVLAVVALFIPGLNVAVLVLGGVLLAGQTLLAASGNGSWIDVGLTVFALATFGVGALASAGLKGAQVATRAAGAQAARAAARGAAQRSSSAARTAAGRTLAHRGATAAQRRGAAGPSTPCNARPGQQATGPPAKSGRRHWPTRPLGIRCGPEVVIRRGSITTSPRCVTGSPGSPTPAAMLTCSTTSASERSHPASPLMGWTRRAKTAASSLTPTPRNTSRRRWAPPGEQTQLTGRGGAE